MTIMESAIAMNNDYIECNNAIGKIELFAEASYKEYEINLKEIALKVLKENGTEDDFDFLATEAAVGYIEKTKKAIAKIIEAVKKFIRTCKENLIKLVTNIKTKIAIDKVDEACKVNSKLRSQKVEYQNTDKQVGILQQGIDRIRKKVAKIKAKGVADSSDIDELAEIEADTTKKAASVAVVVTATLGTALAIFKKFNSKSEIENEIDENAVSDCEISIDENNTKNAETAAFYTRASGLIAKLKKEKVAKKVVKSTSLFTAIKGAFNKFKGKNVSENLEEQFAESTLEDLTMFAYVTESTDTESEEDSNDDVSEDGTIETESAGEAEGLDLDSYFDNLCGELFTNVTTESTDNVETTEDTDSIIEENTDVVDDDNTTSSEEVETESADTDDATFAEVYLEKLESELFGEDEDVATESTDEENISIESLLDEMENCL